VIQIPRPLLAKIITHAAECGVEECCGVLAGTGSLVRAVHPIPNELRSPVAFRTEPRSMLLAQRTMRDAGHDLLAIYHSHPTSPPVPSSQDLAENPFGTTVLCVIIHATTCRAWQLHPDHAEEVEIEVT
jgi:[CysO sulfur-carrier protein]-S-L-cysteine hydrolase